jgi:hypothetical protein
MPGYRVVRLDNNNGNQKNGEKSLEDKSSDVEIKGSIAICGLAPSCINH